MDAQHGKTLHESLGDHQSGREVRWHACVIRFRLGGCRQNELGKLVLPVGIHEWFGKAVTYPAIEIEALSPLDAIGSTQLPGRFHRDPADRMIVALARRHGVPLVTSGQKIIDYPHVTTIW